MYARKRYAVLSLIVLTTMVLTLMFPMSALADGGTPPPSDTPAGNTTNNSTQPSSTEVNSTQAPATNSPSTAASTQAPATDSTTTNSNSTPVSDNAAAALASPAATSVDASSTPAPSESTTPVSTDAVATGVATQTTNSSNNVAAAVTALANAGAVVTDVNGNPVPLASQQAANALSTGDPMGCPSGVKPISWGGTGTGCTSSYSSIQSAINDAAVASGWTIYIDAGTYQENVQVTKSVTLQGAGQGSTIIYPGVSNPDTACMGSCAANNSTDTVIWVKADNVTISDLTVNGDNPFLTSGVVVGGADINAHNGIMSDGTGLTVTNVTVKNVYERGIQSRKDNATYQITHNTVSNVQGDLASIAIFAYDGSGTIAYNNVFDANDAISANWSRGTQFINNTVSNSGSGIHTDNAGEFGSTDVIQGNTISNGPANSYGIFVFAPYNSVTVSNNTITNVDYGLTLSGDGWGAPQNAISFNNNTVQANISDAYVTTDVWGYFTHNVNATFNNNIFTGGQYGFYVESQGSSNTLPGYYSNGCTGNCVLTVSGSNNSITGNTISNVFYAAGQVPWYGGSPDYNGTYNVDLRNNWWGCAGGPSVNSGTVSGSQLYIPALASDPFNPTSCGGGNGNRSNNNVPPAPVVPPVIPITGGEPTTLHCDTTSETLQVGDVQITFTGLCGYDVVMDALTKDTLPGTLGQDNNFADGASLNLLKDGQAVETLPAGASIQVSYPKPSGNAAILAWNGSSWIEKPSTVNGDRVAVNLDLPASTVLVTH